MTAKDLIEMIQNECKAHGYEPDEIDVCVVDSEDEIYPYIKCQYCNPKHDLPFISIDIN